MAIFYELDGGLYVNVTNKCPCSCIFCIRNNVDEIRNSGSMWFEGDEPTMEEIKADYEKFADNEYSEFVFCGYGEPLERLDIVVETAKFLKSRKDIPIRINTNGLSDLINGREHTAYELKGLIDVASISLNAPNPKRYAQVTNSAYGEESFDALLKFAEDAKKVIPKVVFTVVDVIEKEEIEECRKISEDMGITFRARTYVESY